MTDKDNELLLAISNLMDEKLKPIKEDIQGLIKKVTALEVRIANLEARMDKLEARVSKLERSMKQLNVRTSKLDCSMKEISIRVCNIELTQENDTLPRLQNIESCYVDTSRRYQSGIEQLDTMQSDIDVIKRVICEHTEKLYKISSQKVVALGGS